jgi:hypothetical protein
MIGLDAASFEQQPPDEDLLALLEKTGVPVIHIRYGDVIASLLKGS